MKGESHKRVLVPRFRAEEREPSLITDLEAFHQPHAISINDLHAEPEGSGNLLDPELRAGEPEYVMLSRSYCCKIQDKNYRVQCC